jgi:hypothetical protein
MRKGMGMGKEEGRRKGRRKMKGLHIILVPSLGGRCGCAFKYGQLS